MQLVTHLRGCDGSTTPRSLVQLSSNLSSARASLQQKESELVSFEKRLQKAQHHGKALAILLKEKDDWRKREDEVVAELDRLKWDLEVTKASLAAQAGERVQSKP